MDKEIVDPKIGYVVEIPNNNTIIINVGFEDGYQVGDKLKIYEKGPEIVDPKTKEALGRKDYIKDTVEIVETYANFSECQRFVTREKNTFASVGSMIHGSVQKEAVNLNIKTDQNKKWEISNPLITIEDPVKDA